MREKKGERKDEKKLGTSDYGSLRGGSASGGRLGDRCRLVYADNLNYVVGPYLSATGLLDSVTYVDAKYQTPTLAQLQAYDALLVWSHHAYLDPVATGNVLADYVDAGGGVVLCTFSDSYNPIGGRITNSDYSAYTRMDPLTYRSASATLVPVVTDSPILAGVTGVSGYFRGGNTLNAGAVQVATWDDEWEAVAYNRGGKVVNIAIYPGENTSAVNLGGDYARMYANALIFSANPPLCIDASGINA